MDGKKMSGHQESKYEDNIHISIPLSVEGRNIDDMFHNAKVEAAAILGRSIDEVYIQTHTTPRVASQTRFRAHLGEPAFIETWKMDVTIAVKPDEEG